LRRAVERRLATLELDEDRFDREALVHQARLKRLHALLHVRPVHDRARTLFDGPPTGNARAALRQLARCKRKPLAAAELVRRHRLPYLQVEPALGNMPEAVALALVETMEPAELLARLPLLAGRKLLDGLVRITLLGRLTALATDLATRFPYQRVEAAGRKGGLDLQGAQALFAVVAAQQRPGTLSGNTALVVDASSSMAREGGCLELAAGVGWRLDGVLDGAAHLHVYLCGAEAAALELSRGSGLDQWRQALSAPLPLEAGTSLGS